MLAQLKNQKENCRTVHWKKDEVILNPKRHNGCGVAWWWRVQLTSNQFECKHNPTVSDLILVGKGKIKRKEGRYSSLSASVS